MNVDDPSIPPADIVASFKLAYNKVNAREPNIFYRGNQWFIVNGEAVHRQMVMRELARLRALAQQQNLKNTDRSILTRLINKLRGL